MIQETQRTAPHRKLERILDDMGISYLSEFPFLEYSLDIYLPEFHLAIEVDGSQHARFSKRDRFRDRRCREQGVYTHRIRVEHLTEDRVREEVEKFLAYQAPSTEERKELWTAK